MKWYIVYSNAEQIPIEWDRFREADVVYAFAGSMRHLPAQRCAGKILVVFLDKLFAGRSYVGLIERLNQYDADVFLDTPPNRWYDEEIKATRRLAGVVQRGAILPWMHNFKRSQTEKSFLHFARSDPRFEGYIKGTDYVLELLPEFPHYVIGDVKVGNFLGWIPVEQHLELQSKCRLLLFPSRLDSSSRVLSAAIYLDQVPVMAFREAEYLHTLSFGAEPADYLAPYFPIARSKSEFHELARQLMRDDEYYAQWLERMQKYRERHPLIWDISTIYEAFKEKGLLLPRDLTPVHHTLMHGSGLLESIPPGPWSQNSLSLNLH